MTQKEGNISVEGSTISSTALDWVTWDETNGRMILHKKGTGADAGFPFSGGLPIKSMFFTPYYKDNKDRIYSFKSDGTVAYAEGSNNDWQTFMTTTIPNNTDLISSVVVTGANTGTVTFAKSGYYMYGYLASDGYESLTPTNIQAGATRSIFGMVSSFIMIYLGETNPFA